MTGGTIDQVPVVEVVRGEVEGGDSGRDHHWLEAESEPQLKQETAHESALKVSHKDHVCGPMKMFILQM